LLLLALPIALATTTASAADGEAARVAEPGSGSVSTAAPVATSTAGATAHRGADDAVHYRVDVVAPGPIAAAIRSAVDLVRWQDFEDMTELLLERLVRDAVPQAAEAAATQGHFSAAIDVAVDRSTTPVTVRLGVDPGPVTTIRSVDLTVDGPADTVPQGAAAIARLRERWSLPVGEPFQQEAWTAAKQGAVATLAASPFAAARLTASQALVDPPQRAADLSVTIDSGPPFRIGRIDVRGLQRYTPQVIEHFANIQPGDLYDGEALDTYIRRLLASGYFASVQAAIDTDPAQADAATLSVSVIEAPARRVEAGLGYSTNTEFRASFTYNDMNVNGRGLQMYTTLRIESLVQQATARFVLPPRAGGWIDTFGAGAERTDIENLITRTASVTWRRNSLAERRRPAFGLGMYVDEQTPFAQPSVASHALYADAEYTWRSVDNLLDPTKGWMANVQAGWGIPGASTEQFGRTIGKLAAWWPLSPKDDLIGRAEMGAVLASSREGIPSVFLFRTGGDTTVRGYAFESLGVQQESAIVGGRYYALASAEYNHWITPSLGLAAFVDAGNAADQLRDLHLALGYGIGGRLRTPIGPFRLDLAYGQEDHRVRIHFSVGLAF